MFYSQQKIKNLDINTKIYYGHNYSSNNLNFALSIEANNLFLKQRLKQNAPPPTTLKEELQSNPFLKTDSAEIRQSVEKILGKVGNELDLFTKIRYLKDKF